MLLSPWLRAYNSLKLFSDNLATIHPEICRKSTTREKKEGKIANLSIWRNFHTDAIKPLICQMAVYYPHTQCNRKCTKGIMCFKSVGKKFRDLMRGDVTDRGHDVETAE